MTLRSTGLYSCDGALLLEASFLLFRALPSTVNPCHNRGPLVYTTCSTSSKLEFELDKDPIHGNILRAESLALPEGIAHSQA